MNNLVSWWYPIKSPINLFEPHKIPFTAWVHRILSPFNHYITITSPYGLLQSPLKCHFPYRLGPAVDSVQLRYFCGWILWFMVVMGFITNVTGGTIQWTIANLNPPHEIRSEKCHFPIWNHEKSSFNQHFPMLSRERSVYFPIGKETAPNRRLSVPSLQRDSTSPRIVPWGLPHLGDPWWNRAIRCPNVN